MPNKKEWQNQAQALKELLNLDTSPVGVNILSEPLADIPDEKSRICRAILQAAAGKTVQIGQKNNACFGAAWHLGFSQMNNLKVMGMVKKFVVEGEKLFASYEALDKLISQMEAPPDNSKSYFLLSPLESSPVKPQLAIFVVNPEAASRLLTFVTFPDGVMPRIKIGGPTCRLAIIYPLVTGEANISFYDYTARKMCNVDKDKLLVSIPYSRIAQIVESIDKCSAGTAKIEFPPEFRAFLQKRMTSQ